MSSRAQVYFHVMEAPAVVFTSMFSSCGQINKLQSIQIILPAPSTTTQCLNHKTIGHPVVH